MSLIWHFFVFTSFIVMLFRINNVMEESINESLRMNYSVWVKTTGNTASLTFEEWKHLPLNSRQIPIQITIK